MQGRHRYDQWFNALENFVVCLLHLALFVRLGHLDSYVPGDM